MPALRLSALATRLALFPTRLATRLTLFPTSLAACLTLFSACLAACLTLFSTSLAALSPGPAARLALFPLALWCHLTPPAIGASYAQGLHAPRADSTISNFHAGRYFPALRNTAAVGHGVQRQRR